MINSIILSVLSIFNKILSIFEKKTEQKQKDIDKANTEEVVKRAEIVRDINIKDTAEKKISDLNNATNEDEKNKILDDIRRSVS